MSVVIVEAHYLRRSVPPVPPPLADGSKLNCLRHTSLLFDHQKVWEQPGSRTPRRGVTGCSFQGVMSAADGPVWIGEAESSSRWKGFSEKDIDILFECAREKAEDDLDKIGPGSE